VVAELQPYPVDQFIRFPRHQQWRARAYGRRGAVEDSFAVPTNMVHVDGKRATYLTISNMPMPPPWAVVDATRAMMPPDRGRPAPKGMELSLTSTSRCSCARLSQLVIGNASSSSILGLADDPAVLGDWRSTVIVSLSIPLSILAGIIGLLLTGQSINLMTLADWRWRSAFWLDNGHRADRECPPQPAWAKH